MRDTMLTAYGFQRPQDAQPSPQVAILGAWGIIPQQAFWRVENPPKSQTCTCLHCLPICEGTHYVGIPYLLLLILYMDCSKL